MSDKIDDALNVFTSVGYEIAAARSTIVEYIEEMQDSIEELMQQCKLLASDYKESETENEKLRLKVEAYKRYRTENRQLQAKVDDLLEYEGMAYDD